MNSKYMGLFLGCLFSVSTSAAQAMLISYDFAGTIEENSNGTLFPGKSVGESYNGSFTLDTNATKVDDFPSNGSSIYDGTTLALSVEGLSTLLRDLQSGRTIH